MLGNGVRALGLDLRLVGMVGALAIIWIGFDLLTGGAFLTPRNLWNLSVQTASVAVMACGMVLVIVTRNIDLSVGSMLGFVGMLVGVLQAQWLPGLWGFDHPLTWLVAVIAAISLGAAIGFGQGAIIAYLGVPSFIVTLGGLLVWRGAAWWVTTGQTIAPMDPNFRPIGGGVDGAIGATGTWIIAAVASLLVVGTILVTRTKRARFGFVTRSWPAELAVMALCVGAILGTAAVANAYPLPVGIARRLAEEQGIAWPEGGLFIPHGFAVPVLIAIAVGIAVTFLALRTRFGRYVFAIGGNPEAAELSGIDTRRMLCLVYALMGGLVGIAACISTARLNAATNAAGQLDELYVIAAAVIGGTSLAGGMGTIAGAMLGAVVMQSLQSGMVLLGVDTPLQNIVVGVVLVVAVWIDGEYRKRIG